MLASGSRGNRGRAAPVELVALVVALEERDRQDERDRLRLDREVRARYSDLLEGSLKGSLKGGLDRGGLALLRAWLADAPGAATRERVARVRSSLSLLRWALIAIGTFLGWGAASALLRLEVQTGRVNIVLCFGLLVALPLGTLLFGMIRTLWSLRPGSQEDPGAGGWRSFALARLAMRLLSPSVRADVEILLGRLTAHANLYGRVQQAQFLLWSQWFGLAFSTGALIATLLFVVFTDLAFGWSTTLDVAAPEIHRSVSVVASPWAALWPEASPSRELVEATRYFRASSPGLVPGVDPIVYGGWWPFLVMALLTYALVPRALATAGISRWLSVEVGHAIARTPEVQRLLDRLTTPIVESQAVEAEGEVGTAASGLTPVVVASEWIEGSRGAAGDEPLVIRWAEASSDEELFSLLAAATAQLRIRDAGGRRSIEEDAELVTWCRAGMAGVAVCVPAYEPPVLDVLDFLSHLRAAIGRERALSVFLLDGDAKDHEGWRRKLVGLGDPGLSVAVLGARDV